MSPDEALGGILAGASDLDLAARSLAQAMLVDRDKAAPILTAAGLDPRLVAAAREGIGREPGEVGLVVSGAASWARGYRAAPPNQLNWEPVATLAPILESPAALRRETAETLIKLVAEARQRVRIATPYSDVWAAELIAASLAAATARRVEVEVIFPGTRGLGSEDAAIETIRRSIAAGGCADRCRVRRPPAERPWPHLKVLTADSRRAYVGSANLTAAGLTANLEIGVLVEGPPVAVLDALLDLAAGPGT